MTLPLRPHRLAAALFAAALGMAGQAAAQQAPQGSAPGAAQAKTPRPAFCIVNGLEGLPVTAEVRAGKAATQIQIPAGRHACCVKFCAENPAPSGYQISLQAQPAGAKMQLLCKASLASGKVLRVAGDPAQARCEEARL